MIHEEPPTPDGEPPTPDEEPPTPDGEPATPHEEPTISHEEPAILGEEPAEEWLDDGARADLPRRPRRRLLTPIRLVLTGVLLVACGFIGGVLVEKGESSSSPSTPSSGLASRFASLRSPTGGGAGVSRGAAGGSAGGAFASAGSGGRAGTTVGQVAYVSGHTLYVTDPEGNTVKVSASAASTITKTVKAEIRQIHPGETVIVTGNAGTKGAIGAESIRVSEAGGGTLGALLGGGLGRGSGGRGGGASGGAGDPSEGPVLFGK
jgi:hypothetical protein